MNIFALDTNPELAARYHCDRHTVKMILEYTQLLSTAHRILDGKPDTKLSKTGRRIATWRLEDDRDAFLYSATHTNHPSAVWVRESVVNYRWTQNLLSMLSDEYHFRYGRQHKCSSTGMIALLETPPGNTPTVSATELRLAMPDEYKVPSNPVESYRNYYRLGKKHLHSWKGKIAGRTIPEWI
jgi:hypothetical protein